MLIYQTYVILSHDLAQLAKFPYLIYDIIQSSLKFVCGKLQY